MPKAIRKHPRTRGNRTPGVARRGVEDEGEGLVGRRRLYAWPGRFIRIHDLTPEHKNLDYQDQAKLLAGFLSMVLPSGTMRAFVGLVGGDPNKVLEIGNTVLNEIELEQRLSKHRNGNNKLTLKQVLKMSKDKRPRDQILKEYGISNRTYIRIRGQYITHGDSQLNG